VKFSKTILLPVAALVIVGAFWGVIAFLRRPSPPAPSATPGAASNPPAETRGGLSPAAGGSPAESADVSHSGRPPQAGQPGTSALHEDPAKGLAQAEGSPTAGDDNPQGRTGIYINGREISQQQVEQLRAMYGYVAPPGKYWYDFRGGLYGTMGYEAAGFMRPGHDFGPLPANASNGNTGVFINGRQINMNEAMYCQRLFGAVYQGHWWLDGRTGNMGAEGNPTPIVNVFVALQQAQRSNQGGSYSWHSNTTGASGGSSGGCSYVSIPGSGTVSSGNCD